jgi:hypothetical protein
VPGIGEITLHDIRPFLRQPATERPSTEHPPRPAIPSDNARNDLRTGQ